jgi:uncharacterized protein YaiE (UPF0345 family)
MALKTLLFAALFSWVLGCSGAFAAGNVHRYEVVNGSCQVHQKVGRDWKKAPPGIIRLGSILVGRTYAMGSYLIFHKDGGIYTLPTSCLREQSSASGPKWSAFVSAISWNESLTLSSPTQGSYHLNASPLGLCLGGSATWNLSSAWNARASGCFLYATSDLGVTQGQPAPTSITYSAQGARLIGFVATPGVVWKSPKTGVDVGIQAPIVYRQANWPAPGGDFQVSGGSSFLVGVAVEPSYSFGPCFVSTEVGLLNFTTDFLWSLSFGYRF